MPDNSTPESSSVRDILVPQNAEGKRKRSRQVCTECRQRKLQCDAQDRFPAPCSRCSVMDPQPICRVDPAFKRTRKAQHSQSMGSSSKLSSNDDNPHTDNDTPSPAVTWPLGPDIAMSQVPILGGSQLTEAIWPTTFALGSVQISLNQATSLFDEFFTHFHPHCPLFLYRREPIALHSQDTFLFWSIICVASRKPALDPVARATLEGVSYTALANEIKRTVADFGMYPPRKVSIVQGLLLLCEWPLPAHRQRDDRIWHYSSLAIQCGLQMGFHRPHYPHEYSSWFTGQPKAESPAGQERIVAWIYCHINGYSIASIHGLPSLVRDDYVTLEASSAAPGNTPSWLAGIPRKVIDTLRIARLDERAAQALGNSNLSPSGQLSGPSTTSIFSLCSSELNELERNIISRDAATTLRLHLCRMRMCAFELQSIPTPSCTMTRALAATDCYVSCMRIAEAACTIPRDEVARWPFSLSFGYSIACICLIRLLSTEDGRSLDMNAALTQISAVFRLASELNVGEDSLRRRFNQLISFSVKDAQARRTAPTDSEEDGSSMIHSRMGLSNWLHDSIERATQARTAHEALHNRRGGEIISYASDDEREESWRNQHGGEPLIYVPDDARERSTTWTSDPPPVDYSMFTSSDFDDILASFSQGEWPVPVEYFTAG
ncbi:hypothetical protein FIBSPDRAFT_1048064 [Athelia psychrophila]|uniref:Zn(2)-C6 fungal-type domain-containing protein n=1 Tax=Athelia psychrophila TaxID=1759441 RepID=A0A166EA61_9AGAM|nr:hypothetical protein FIBSPDRAFT_1048064 [Fibularhizoctonia sp. CBS 109695]